jgi:anti-sigma regulatory factor (Ser/Thr protein kinase)
VTAFERELPVAPTAGLLARQTLDGWLTDLVGDDTARDIRLAANELVTNAVRHGRLPATGTIRLSGFATPEVVRLEVEQASSAAGARLVSPGERDPLSGGHGLRIVNELSSRWGIEEGPPGRVWFEVGREPSAGSTE